jgi:DNA-binding transcriptional MocR family regulator
LFVTTGASQGLDLICTLFTQPGDTIFVEEPTYFLALRIFTDHHLNIVSIPIDDNGLVVEALEEKLAEYRPVFLYTIPTFHNPGGVTLSAARRERLVRLSEQHDFLIVADEVYHLLAYTAMPPPPLPSYDERGTVLSLGSFSKIMAPGLRLGWIQAKPLRLERLVGCGLVDSGGGLNPFTAGLVRSALELGIQQEQLIRLKNTYRQGTAVLSQALREHIPSFKFIEPQGGFFVWGQLPEEVNTEALLPIARRYQVGFQPGLKFSSRQGLRNYVRLSFAYYDEEELREGVQRLARVISRDLKVS